MTWNMNRNMLLVLGFVFASEIVAVIESKEFCQMFAENNNRIDYLFRRVFSDNDLSNPLHNIVIKGHYWTVRYDEIKDILQLDSSEENGVVDAFVSDALIGPVFLRLSTEPKYQTILVMKSLRFNRAVIPNDDFTDILAMNYKNNGSVNIEGMTGIFSPEMVFGSNDVIVAVTRYVNDLESKSFPIRQTADGLIVSKIKSDRQFFSFHSEYDVMAISVHHSNNSPGYLMILGRGQEVYWCLYKSNQDCLANLFINCTDQVFTTTAEPEDNPKDTLSTSANDKTSSQLSVDSVLLYILILGVIFLVVIIAFVVIICIHATQNTRQPFELSNRDTKYPSDTGSDLRKSTLTVQTVNTYTGQPVTNDSLAANSVAQKNSQVNEDNK